MAAMRLGGIVLLLGSPWLSGCNVVSAIAYFFGPPQIQRAEFKLTSGRLAVLVEMVRPEEDNPVFVQALHDKLAEIFRDRGIKAQLIPLEDIARLRQQSPDFGQWSLQKLGRRLNAQQVLYVRVERLQIREAPGSPVLVPVADLRLKLIDPNAPPEAARLWPGRQEHQGREVQRARPAREATDGVAIDSEAAKLGKDAAWLVAMPFYDVDLEQKTPWEP